jgi:hypothetical protein
VAAEGLAVKRPARILAGAAVPGIPAAVAGVSVRALAGTVLAVMIVVAALCWVIADPDRTGRLVELIAAARGRGGMTHAATITTDRR